MRRLFRLRQGFFPSVSVLWALVLQGLYARVAATGFAAIEIKDLDGWKYGFCGLLRYECAVTSYSYGIRDLVEYCLRVGRPPGRPMIVI